MLRLALRYQEQIRYFPMPDREVQLGAAADNDLVAPFPGISGHHAKLSPEGGAVRVIDLGSTNGLVREGRRLDEILLTPGKEVGLGDAVLTLEDLSSSDGETGLRSQASSGAERVGPPATETAALTQTAGSSPAAALRFVRELERGVGDPPARLRSARRALGAESLLIFDFRTSDNPALIACAGPLPPDFDSGETLVVAGTRGERLIAFFGTVPAPWQRDFFAYLGEKLLGAASPPQPQDPPGLPEDLPLPPGMVVGTSIAMRDLLAQLRAMARSDLSVLLTGETGTGKELFARLIHESGAHSGGPFVAVNCAAIPAELLEAELFGIASRVATGVDPRPGLFVQANGGTLFLDEIGDMPERLQAKLLRALQEREVLPLGGTAPRKIDARIVAASNRDLRRLVGEGTFRADLYYRLRGIELRLPPLRERSEDLPPLILAFAARAAAKYGKRVHGVSEKALSVLLAYDWPGNVRELESEIERAVLLCPEGGTLQREHLGALEPATAEPVADAPPPPTGMDRPELTGSLREQVEALEREAILRALAAAQGNKSKAAEQLGISRNGLVLKMDRMKISSPE